MITELKIPHSVKEEVSGLTMTASLFNKNAYIMKYKAKVLKIVNFEDKSYIVLNQTCFFPEGGGQLGDTGVIESPFGKFKVVDTQTVDDIILHIVPGKCEINEGDSVLERINWKIRYERMKQHTASHILFSAIRKVLNLEQLIYMGVHIKEDVSRIDISYDKPISVNQLREIESISNKVCLENRRLKTWFTTRDEAERIYGKQLGITEVTPSGLVRVVEVKNWDVALCCGTHVNSTVEIGLIKIFERYKLQKGVERIRFTAGNNAFEQYSQDMQILTDLAQILMCSVNEVLSRVKVHLEERDDLKKKLERVNEQIIEAQIHNLIKESVTFGEFNLLQKRLSELSIEGLKRIASSLVKKDPNLVVVLGSDYANKAFIIGAAGEKVLNIGVNMTEMIREAAKVIQGGGGGTPGLAQAGGYNINLLEEALDLYIKEVSNKILILH